MSDGKSSAAAGCAATTLEQALRNRKSSREYSDRPLPEDLLLRLLWAGGGVNRPESGRRTAPTALDRREVSIYVARPDGLFLYDPDAAALHKVLGTDLRGLTGVQDFVGTAPVNLVYVSDLSRLPGDDREKLFLMAGLDVGFVSQNVSLFCAAEGLATVPRTSVNAADLGKAMALASHERVIMAQCVGYPK